MEFDIPFYVRIDDVFFIKGRGVVVTGRVERGPIRVGDEVEITGRSEIIHSKILGIEIFHKTLDFAETGDHVGLVLEGVSKDQLQKGMLIRSSR